jgi:hypothetical protein
VGAAAGEAVEVEVGAVAEEAEVGAEEGAEEEAAVAVAAVAVAEEAEAA